MGVWSPFAAALPNEINVNERGGGAEGIDDHVPKRGLACGDEGLMEFVGDRVNGADDLREVSGFAIPGCRKKRAAASAPNENSEDCVAADVAGFADDGLDVVDCFVGDGRAEEAEKWADDSRGVMSGAEIGGSGENHGHPNEDGEPVFGEIARRHCADETTRAPSRQIRSVAGGTGALRSAHGNSCRVIGGWGSVDFSGNDFAGIDRRDHWLHVPGCGRGDGVSAF